MEDKQFHIFGPIPSRRFGVSLGIDPFFDKKICNLDCLYCELERAKKSDGKEFEHVKADIILKELEERLKDIQTPDVITLSANGEPTLYKYLDELIDGINSMKGGAKSLILSNGTTINIPVTRKSLTKLDIVKLSLDSIEQKIFKKIDRGMKGINVSDIIDGMVRFREEYDGDLVLEILLVKGVNDGLEEAKKYKQYLKLIKPDRIDISTIHRPPAYPVVGVEHGVMEAFASELGGYNIFIASNRQIAPTGNKISKDEFLNTISKRVLTKNDILTLFGEETLNIVLDLLQDGDIIKKSVGNIDFFAKKS